MDLDYFQNVIVINNFGGGRIELRNSRGEIIQPKEVISFMKQIQKKIEATYGKQ